MTDDTENESEGAQTGEEIRDEVQADLDRVKVAAISYVYEEDGEYHASTARFCLHDEDEGEAEMMDHLKVDIGLQRLQEDSLLGALGGQMGGGPGGLGGVVAMSAEEAEEAGILEGLEEMMESEQQADDDSDDDPMFF